MGVLSGLSGKPLTLAFSSNGRYLYDGDDAGHVSVWEMASFKQAGDAQLFTKAVNSLALTPDGKTLAVAGEGPRIPYAPATTLFLLNLSLADTFRGPHWG